MAGRLRILSAGICCTFQDAGRIGHLRNGVANSGPMDWLAFALAARLASLPATAVGIEVSVGGLELEALETEVLLGLAGGGFRVSIDRNPVEHPACARLRPGQRLTVKTGSAGAWFYVVPAMPIDIEPVLGSCATHARYAIGPSRGKRLEAGDEIALREAGAGQPQERAVAFPHLSSEFPIRATLGPQRHMFDDEDIARFFSSRFVLSDRMDRMAYVLDGPRITPSSSYAIATEGTALGSIQIAGDGSPYILMADRSSMGGYPKIATITRADIGRFAQKRPGDPVEFQETSIDAAVALLRDLKREVSEIGVHGRKGWIDLEALLLGAGNSGVIDALSNES